MKKIVFVFLLSIAAQFATAQSAISSQAFDNIVVPGVRVGPVAIGGYIDEMVAKLGKPDKTIRQTSFGPAPYITYYYLKKRSKDNYISFSWHDKDLRPVEEGYISTNSDYWITEKGIHVGSSIHDVVATYGEPGRYAISDNYSVIMYNSGIQFFVKDRNSPVFQITICSAEYWDR